MNQLLTPESKLLRSPRQEESAPTANYSEVFCREGENRGLVGAANESPMSDIFSARSRVLAQCEERGDCRKCALARSCPDFQLDLSLQRSLHSSCGRVCIVFEVDQVDILARSMLRHFQKIDNAQKAGASRQFGRDVRQRNPPDRGHFNEPFAQSVTSADLDTRPTPYPHAAGDFAAHDWRAKSLGEHHSLNLFYLPTASLICDLLRVTAALLQQGGCPHPIWTSGKRYAARECMLKHDIG